MEKEKIKQIIRELLQQGESLGHILKILENEYQESMTFLELRLLASEIEGIDWGETENPEPPPPTGDSGSNDEPEKDTDGKTIVEVNRLARPGVVMHGTVKFASGAKADWILDQMGRLGLEKTDGKPTAEDLQAFQEELQKTLGGGQ